MNQIFEASNLFKKQQDQQALDIVSQLLKNGQMSSQYVAPHERNQQTQNLQAQAAQLQ